MNATTPKQAVQAVYPTAKSRRVRSAGYWYQYRVEADGVELGVDCCPQGAWRDAASKLPAPISGGSPEADGGQHSAPATDGGTIDPVEVVSAGAELYRETFATTKSTVRRFMRADAAMAVRRMFRALPAEGRLALRPHLVALCPEAREGDPETMLEAWFLDVCQRLGSGLGIESAACPVSFPPAGGDFDGADLPELDDAERVALEVLGDGEMDRLARMTEGEAAMAMEAMGVGPVSGGSEDDPELLPCPFCGRHSFLSIHPGDVTAYCGSCKASIKRFGYGRSCIDTVVELWNRREQHDIGEVVDRLTWQEKARDLGIPPVSGGSPEPELLPCPFCGRTPKANLDAELVRCDECGAQVAGDDIGHAVALWNRRAVRPGDRQLLVDLYSVIFRIRRSIEAEEVRWLRHQGHFAPGVVADRQTYERLQRAVDRLVIDRMSGVGDGHWFDAEESLPLTDDDVLVLVADPGPADMPQTLLITAYRDPASGVWRDAMTGDNLRREPIAWQILPEVPTRFIPPSAP